jgi:hypothetical protein
LQLAHLALQGSVIRRRHDLFAAAVRRQPPELFRGNAMSASHQAYRHARLERLLDDPNLLRRCPAPTALKRCAASPSLKTACWRARGLGHDAVRGDKNCKGSGQSLTNRNRAQLKWNQPAGFSLA